MADTLSQEDRRKRMALIRGTDSAPEMAVRRLVPGWDFDTGYTANSFPGSQI